MRVHRDLSKILVVSHKLCIDRANFVERVAQLVQVADELGDVDEVGIAYIISLGPAAGLADRQSMLGSVAGALAQRQLSRLQRL
jgi:hypothetical protein